MGDPMTKINGHEVQYFVNEEKKTVTAKIINTRVDAWERFTEISHLDYCWNVSKKTLFSFDMQSEMSCTAKCHPDDEFDVAVGMVIAYKKLQKKYWYKYANAMDKIIEYIYACSMTLGHEYAKSDRKYNNMIDSLYYFEHKNKQRVF